MFANAKLQVIGTAVMYVYPKLMWFRPGADLSSSERWHTWTATLWLLAGMTAFTTMFTFFFLPETLSSNILLRRAQRIRRQTGDLTYRSQSEVHAPTTDFFSMLLKQTVDDLKLSCMDPVILFINIQTMFIYGILYLWFEFFPFGMKLYAVPTSSSRLTSS
jgi:DHA1 family multidrug resistance protein-like MFS transporter